MESYSLLEGKEIDLEDLSPSEQVFLRGLQRLGEQDMSYFEIYRMAVGPGSPALRGRNRIDRRTMASPLYLAARDIATRAGIAQGLILAPDSEPQRAEFPAGGAYISAAQAAGLIGISRAAVYKAIRAGTVQALRIGNVTVVDKDSALAYRERREAAGRASAERGGGDRDMARESRSSGAKRAERTPISRSARDPVAAKGAEPAGRKGRQKRA